MNYFERRRILKKTSALDLVPVRIRGHEAEEDKIVVLVPKYESRIYHIFSSRLKELHFRIRLDQLGSATWEAMDGNRSVRDISDHLKEHPVLKQHDLSELDDRLSKYMTMMYERRFITFRQIMESD